MRHAWKYAALFGFVAAGISLGCTVSTDDDVATGGTGGTTGGASALGGSGGSSTSGNGGTGGSLGGSSGSGGSSGTTSMAPTCDADASDTGMPYPTCAPTDATDECEVCIQTNCCEESQNCFATEPYNVCGWGGPDTDDESTGVVSGIGEIGCYRSCLAQYVNDNGVCDGDGIDQCATACATPACDGLPGDATSTLAACMQTSCSQDCFGAAACDAD